MPNPKSNDWIELMSFLGGIVSFILFLASIAQQSRIAQSLSLLGLATSTGGIVACALSDHTHQTREEVEALTQRLRDRDRTLAAKDDRIATLTAELNRVMEFVDRLNNAPIPVDRTSQIVAQYQEKLNTLQARYRAEVERVKTEAQSHHQTELDRLQSEMVAADTRIHEFEQRFLDRAQETLSEALTSFHDRISDLVADNLRKLSHLEPETCDAAFAKRLQQLSEEATALHETYVAQILNLSHFLDAENILDCSDEALSILYHLMDDYTSIKVKVINALKAKTVRELYATIRAYQDAELVPKAQLEQLVKNLKLRLQEYELDAAQHQESVVAIANDYEAQTLEDDRIVRGYIDKLARLEHDNHQLKEQVASLSALKKFDAGAWGWGADIGNQVIDYLMSENIPCDALPLDFSPTDSHLTIALNCRTEAGLRMLAKDGKEFEKGIAAAKGWSHVSLTLTGRVVKVTVQYANRAIAKTKPEAVLDRPISDWDLYLAAEYHWFIAAATQSGKTTLVDELNALLYQQLKGDIEFHAITLKTDGNRDAEKAKRFVAPVFKSSSKDYFEAQASVLEEIESRKQILAVNPNYCYPRSIHQWDEYGEHYRVGGMREVTKMVLISSLQVGAGLSSENGKGIQVTFIAQNPYVSQLGLFRPDLANCCLIIVGEKNIRLFLNSDEDNHGLDKEDLERLKKELSLFKDASRKAVEKAQSEAQKNGTDPRIAIAKCPERYYSLILPSKGGLKPIILYNPAPGQFTNPLTQPQLSTSQNQPESTCEHDYKVVRSRKTKDGEFRQREMKCKRCGDLTKNVEPL
jgi:hypothetical protein